MKRVNVGCGRWPLPFWINLDESRDVVADLYAHVPPLPFPDADVDDIFAGHFLEHLEPDEADAFLVDAFRALKPGGRLGIVVPDIREVLTRWMRGAVDCIEYPSGRWHAVADLDDVCAVFLYSTVQPSRHRWAYDLATLTRRVKRAGFVIVGEIDRYRDHRIPIGTWYQCGIDARKP